MAVRLALLGRLSRLSEGEVTSRAQGNSVVTSGIHGERAAQPGKGGGVDASPVGGEQLITTPSSLNRATYARPTQNNRLVLRDRHIISRRGKTVTSPDHQEPASGIPNPEADGPARPSHEMVDRTISFQIGTDATRNLDNDAPHAATSAGGKRFPLGNQGSAPWEPVYGGTPGLYRPYGARGFVEGPEASLYSLPGGPSRPGVLLERGDEHDGPQALFGGYPHGLHSTTVPGTKVTRGRYKDTTQQTPPRQQRPAGSKIAGQSYSQTVVGQDGKGGGPLPKMSGGRAAGSTMRFLGR